MATWFWLWYIQCVQILIPWLVIVHFASVYISNIQFNQMTNNSLPVLPAIVNICTTWLVAWHSGKNVGLGRLTLPVARSTFSWWVTIYVGKPSAGGQPTRSTQPFILLGSINEQWAAIRCLLPQSIEAPSGECLRGKGRHGVPVWSMPERCKWFVYHARRYTSALLYLLTYFIQHAYSINSVNYQLPDHT